MDTLYDRAVLRDNDVSTGSAQFYLVDDGLEIPFDTDDGGGEPELEGERQAWRKDKIIADMDGLPDR